jgi:hypothetical protein
MEPEGKSVLEAPRKIANKNILMLHEFGKDIVTQIRDPSVQKFA